MEEYEKARLEMYMVEVHVGTWAWDSKMYTSKDEAEAVRALRALRLPSSTHSRVVRYSRHKVVVDVESGTPSEDDKDNHDPG